MSTPRTDIRVGDHVRVSFHAPATHRPGTRGIVVEVRRLDDEGHGCRVNGGPSGEVVRVRDPDGESFEIPLAQILRD